MEGTDIYELNVIERSNKNNVIIECKRCKKSILVYGIIISLVIGIIITPALINIHNYINENLIYMQYSRYEIENEIEYTNEELKVSISHNFEHGYDIYKASWINFHGETDDSSPWQRSRTTTLGTVLNHAVELSDIQIKWFEYMFKFVVKQRYG